MAEEEKFDVVVSVVVHVPVKITDSGYLGERASVSEHMEAARAKVRNWQFLIKQGSRDAEVVPANFTVENVNLIPRMK